MIFNRVIGPMMIQNSAVVMAAGGRYPNWTLGTVVLFTIVDNRTLKIMFPKVTLNLPNV
jgi:hypothetical protein